MTLGGLYRGARQRVLLRGVHYSDRHERMDRLYRLPDPWQLDCAREHHRFATTNRIIERVFGRPKAILEIGCGEGLQSTYLSGIADSLHGVDVSSAAVMRARLRCPGGRFDVADIMSGAEAAPMADLAVACEVLYYVGDIPAFLARMSQLGRACLISYDTAQAEPLGQALRGQPMAGSETIVFGKTQWVVSWWNNP